MADELPTFAYTGEWRTCLFCGSLLADEQAFFDSDLCGRLFADQLAVRGLRLHAEEIVAVQ